MGWEARVNGSMIRVGDVPAGRGKVVIGYPVGGSVTLAFHVSMLRLLGYDYEKPVRERVICQMTHSQGLYVADNRTLLVQRLLADPRRPDWLLQIDTDIEFPVTLVDDLLRLAGHDKKILGASVPLPPYASCAFMRDQKPGVWHAKWPVPLTPTECDGLATAVCLVHREVFETIAERHGQCWFHHMYLPDSPEGTPPRDFKFISSGEDVAFSLRAAREGYKLWAVHLPGIQHHKTRRLSHDDERAQMLATQDAGVGELVAEG
jgi:hypothetical protein